EHAVRVAVIGDLEEPALRAEPDHAAGLGELARVRRDRAIVLDPARGHAHGQAGGVTLEPGEHPLPVPPLALAIGSPSLDGRQVLEEEEVAGKRYAQSADLEPGDPVHLVALGGGADIVHAQRQPGHGRASSSMWGAMPKSR